MWHPAACCLNQVCCPSSAAQRQQDITMNAAPPPSATAPIPKELPPLPLPPGVEPCLITCPPDRHISVEFSEICSLLVVSMSVVQRERFEEVVQLLECLYSQEFLKMRRALKHNFLPFSAGAKDEKIQARVGRGLPPREDLDIKELKFVSDIIQLMAAARFSIISKEEWDTALDEDFQFTLPVQINWEYFDDKLLPTFWSSSVERAALRKKLPDMADRMLMFHRGITVAKASGLYITEKVDLLVDYIVVQPALRVWHALKRRLTWRRAQVLHEVNGIPTMESSPAKPAIQHQHERTVERRTLRRLLPTARLVLQNFPRKMHLQEPSFKEVVVLYRAAVASPHTNTPVAQRTKDTRLRSILRKRNIHMKCFHNIPLADSEVVFPEKKVFLKPLALIQLLLTAITALVAASVSFIQAKSSISPSVLWSILSVVGARCGHVWSSAQAERSKTIQTMVNILYDKTNDAQEGVVSMLLEDMADQQVKEAVLAYAITLKHEVPISTEQLDRLCEDFLRDQFDLHVDFMVDDAAARLLDWGLLVPAEAGRLRPIPVDKAAVKLQQRWNQAGTSINRPHDDKVLPLSSLLQDFEDLDSRKTTAPQVLQLLSEAVPPPVPKAHGRLNNTQMVVDVTQPIALALNNKATTSLHHMEEADAHGRTASAYNTPSSTPRAALSHPHFSALVDVNFRAGDGPRRGPHDDDGAESLVLVTSAGSVGAHGQKKKRRGLKKLLMLSKEKVKAS